MSLVGILLSSRYWMTPERNRWKELGILQFSRYSDFYFEEPIRSGPYSKSLSLKLNGKLLSQWQSSYCAWRWPLKGDQMFLLTAELFFIQSECVRVCVYTCTHVYSFGINILEVSGNPSLQMRKSLHQQGRYHSFGLQGGPTFTICLLMAFLWATSEPLPR